MDDCGVEPKSEGQASNITRMLRGLPCIQVSAQLINGNIQHCIVDHFEYQKTQKPLRQAKLLGFP